VNQNGHDRSQALISLTAALAVLLQCPASRQASQPKKLLACVLHRAGVRLRQGQTHGQKPASICRAGQRDQGHRERRGYWISPPRSTTASGMPALQVRAGGLKKYTASSPKAPARQDRRLRRTTIPTKSGEAAPRPPRPRSRRRGLQLSHDQDQQPERADRNRPVQPDPERRWVSGGTWSWALSPAASRPA